VFQVATPGAWTPKYAERVERNIGVVGVAEQERLRTARIAVLGTGGLGAPLALQLVYAGCQNLVLADFDTVESSNLNRQPFTGLDVGRPKVEVLAERLRAIDPEVHVVQYQAITHENVAEVLAGVEVVALTLDGFLGTLLVTREARARGIPVVETWAAPFLFTWWFEPEGPSYEEVYGLPTAGIPYEAVANDPELLAATRLALVHKVLSLFPGIQERFAREPGAFEALAAGEIPNRSFAPVVWLNASLAAFDVLFAGVLGIKSKTVAPTLRVYDYLNQVPLDLS
jgi:hypothetical protein